ncbi:MAG: sugar ABC transporter ATP-binding protein [Chloroflexi bacterium]|nr:sugar ABC transporter ATP-binding protein [Chloroflexota bacterium]
MSNNPDPIWEARRVSKAFPGVQALNRVSIALNAGEIHALVGQNGSGKSTLVKCFAGVHLPEEGEIRLKGQPVVMSNPTVARARGVATIYQELSLVPTLTVAENICLGRLPTSTLGRLVDWDSMRRRAVQTLKELGIELDPNGLVRSLSVAEQQLVEIAKAISEDSTLLIMDEPTASLGLNETKRLQGLIRQLAKQGKAVLYISHRIDEVFMVADRITVLRDGKVVDTQSLSAVDPGVVVRLMLGTEVKETYPKEHHATAEPILAVEGLRTEEGVNGVSFTIQKGEVFGLGGMVGSGRSEIGRALFGVDPITAGTVRLDGVPLHLKAPSQAIAAGIALLPENPKADGLFFNFRGPQNITIADLRAILSGPFLNLRREEQYGVEYFDKLRISRTGLERTVQYLSGGNQQKTILARWLFTKARLLILDEPTQGVDIGARIEVYHIINELTSMGIGILLISSDYPELLAMSDRVAIVRDGHILQIADAGSLTEYQLLETVSQTNHLEGVPAYAD